MRKATRMTRKGKVDPTMGNKLARANKILGQIAEGWRNHLIPPQELKGVIKTVSLHRLTICEGCEYHSKNHHTPKRPDAHCTDCGCTLLAKTKCLSCRCPLKIPKWVEVQAEP